MYEMTLCNVRGVVGPRLAFLHRHYGGFELIV